MPNENCLRGIRCPKCGSETEFDIVVEVVARLQDDGVHEYREPDWGSTSTIQCREFPCEHSGTVAEFTVQDSSVTDE